tara:strand:- start:415 stop:735 length:321 start_codon:yes stop_codon:yes gene_type:complete
MDKLFTKTSKVLRDNWIIELQKSHDFLKYKLSNINQNPFFGYKVVIKEHARNMGTGFISRTPGILYEITRGQAWILYKNEDNEKKISQFFLNNIELVDDRFEKLFE